jgi:nucleoside-diphosphate-sugar epimerase
MSQQLHVVVGAGAIGSGVARRLVEQGHRVRVVTRSGGTGTGGPIPGIEPVAADAADSTRLTELTRGATAIYNCVNPAYHRWAQDWPPVATALLEAASANDAVLATVSNLYGYGPSPMPMTESLPLTATFINGRVRAQMWQQALAAHQGGRVRVTEARGSDYIGPHTQGQYADRAVPNILNGKGVTMLGAPDVEHTLTYSGDMATTLVTLAADSRAWGQAWHVPSLPALTPRQVIAGLCESAGVKPVAVRRAPALALKAMGVFMPAMRPMADVMYQHASPFVMDSSAAQQTFGLTPTPWPQVYADTVAAYR